MIKHDLILEKMSTEYFKTLSWALGMYGAMLKEHADKDPFSNESKDYSICLETFFSIEPKISKKEQLKPEIERKRQNKRLKIRVHSGIVVFDALHYIDGDKEFYQVPAIEHIKEQITKQLL